MYIHTSVYILYEYASAYEDNQNQHISRFRVSDRIGLISLIEAEPGPIRLADRILTSWIAILMRHAIFNL